MKSHKDTMNAMNDTDTASAELDRDPSKTFRWKLSVAVVVTVASVVATIMATGPTTAQVTYPEGNAAPHQGIPDDYREYFYGGDLDGDGAETKMPLVGAMRVYFNRYPQANGWYNGEGILRTTETDAKLVYTDHHGNQLWDPRESIWYDTDGDGVYDADETEPILYAGVLGDPEEGDTGTGNGIHFVDSDEDGYYTLGVDQIVLVSWTTRSVSNGTIRYRDANGDGVWNKPVDGTDNADFEYVFVDSNGNKTYDPGETLLVAKNDTGVLTHPVEGETYPDTLNTKDWSKSNGFHFSDVNDDDDWNENEAVWYATDRRMAEDVADMYSVLELTIPSFTNPDVDPKRKGDQPGPWTIDALLAKVEVGIAYDPDDLTKRSWTRIPEVDGFNRAVAGTVTTDDILFSVHFQELYTVMKFLIYGDPTSAGKYDSMVYDEETSKAAVAASEQLLNVYASLFGPGPNYLPNVYDFSHFKNILDGKMQPSMLVSHEHVNAMREMIETIAEYTYARGNNTEAFTQSVDGWMMPDDFELLPPWNGEKVLSGDKITRLDGTEIYYTHVDVTKPYLSERDMELTRPTAITWSDKGARRALFTAVESNFVDPYDGLIGWSHDGTVNENGGGWGEWFGRMAFGDTVLLKHFQELSEIAHILADRLWIDKGTSSVKHYWYQTSGIAYKPEGTLQGPGPLPEIRDVDWVAYYIYPGAEVTDPNYDSYWDYYYYPRGAVEGWTKSDGSSHSMDLWVSSDHVVFTYPDSSNQLSTSSPDDSVTDILHGPDPSTFVFEGATWGSEIDEYRSFSEEDAIKRWPANEYLGYVNQFGYLDEDLFFASGEAVMAKRCDLIYGYKRTTGDPFCGRGHTFMYVEYDSAQNPVWHHMEATAGGDVESSLARCGAPNGGPADIYGRVPVSYDHYPRKSLPPLVAKLEWNPFAIRSAEALATTQKDSNRDDLVDVGASLSGLMNETGVIAHDLYREKIQGYLPMFDATWNQLAVHAALVNGGFEYANGTDWTHPDVDEDLQPWRYTLDTKVRTSVHMTDPADLQAGNNVKRIEVIRPRGNPVVFDFPWDSATSAFKPYGLPVTQWLGKPTTTEDKPLNGRRTYVLWAMPNGTYELRFESGITHVFGSGGSLTAVKHVDGSSVAVNGITGYDHEETLETAGSQGQVKLATSPRFVVESTFANGQLADAYYVTRSDSTKYVKTTLTYAATAVTGMSKEGKGTDAAASAIPEYSYSVSGNIITRNGITNAVARTATTVETTVTQPDVNGSSKTTVTLNADDMVKSTKIEVNGGSTETKYVYSAAGSTQRYAKNQAAKWSKLSCVEYPDKSWESFVYEETDTGWLTQHLTPFKDASLGSDANSCSVTEIGYDRNVAAGATPDEAADLTQLTELPRKSTSKVLGSTVGLSYVSYFGTDRGTVESRTARTYKSGTTLPDWADTDYLLVTTSQRNLVGPPNVDGPTGKTANSTSVSGDCLEMTTSSTSYGVDDTTPIATSTTSVDAFGAPFSNSSTRDGLIVSDHTAQLDDFGRTKLSNDLIANQQTDFEDATHPLTWYGSNISISKKNGHLVGKSEVIARFKNGSVKTSKSYVGTTLAFTATVAIDLSNGKTSTTVTGTDGSLSRTDSTTADAQGRTVESIQAEGKPEERTTKTEYDDAARTVTVTYPKVKGDGDQYHEPTSVTEYYVDGSTKVVFENSIEKHRYYKGIETIDGIPRLFSKSDSLNTVGAWNQDWSKSWFNLLGQSFRNQKSGITNIASTYFDAKSRPVVSVDFGGLTTASEYNNKNQVSESRLLIGGTFSVANGIATVTPDDDGDDRDRVSRFENGYASRDGVTVMHSSTVVEGGTEPSSEVESDSSVDGLQSWSSVNGRTPTHTLTTITGDFAGTTVTTHSDGTVSTSTTENSSLLSSVWSGGTGLAAKSLSTGYSAFDAFRRPTVTTNNAGQTTTVNGLDTMYQPSGVDRDGGRGVQGMAYDESGNLTDSTIKGTTDNTTVARDAHNNVAKISGTADIPSEHGADARGVPDSLKTDPDGNGVVTKYARHPQLGVVLKRILDQNGAEQHDYEVMSYDPATGRFRSIEQMGPGGKDKVKHIVDYDPKTGDVETQKIDVDADDNAARTFGFTQTTRGQLHTVEDSKFGAGAYATLEHNADGTVTSEVNAFTGVTLTRGTDGQGRVNNVSLSQGGNTFYSVPVDRTDGLQRFDGTGGYTWTFVDGTSLIDVVTLGNGFAIDYDYDESGKTYRLQTITFKKNTTPYYVINCSSTDDYDARDRLKAATTTMSFPDLPKLDFGWSFGYGDYNQMGGETAMSRSVVGPTPEDSDALAFIAAFPASFSENYDFDAIGNDKNANKLVNRLNQIVRRYNPVGQVSFGGTVHHDALVTQDGTLPSSRARINDVQGTPTDLDGFTFNQVYDNENGPVRKMLEFTAVRYDKALGKDVVSTRYALLEMPGAVDDFAFDGRGNRLETAMCDLSYTARNRLKSGSSKMIKKLIPAPDSALSVNGNEYTVNLAAASTVSYLRLETAGNHSAAQLTATLQALVGGVWTALADPEVQLFHNPVTDKTVLFLGIANPVVATKVRTIIGGTTPPTFTGATSGNVIADEPLKKEKGRAVYKYDFFGQRVEKASYSWDDATNDWKVSNDEKIKFVYDGWLLLAELDANDNDALLRSYVWGPDLSGSRSGMAGIGGLLAVTDHVAGKTYHPFTDGRGNIMGYVDSGTGQVVAAYFYDPFGKTIGQWGTLADAFKFRFSTKYFDVETSTYYYGYRDYDPDTKTWLTRDPKGEAGGMNLYAFCSNNPVFGVDPTGLDMIKVRGRMAKKNGKWKSRSTLMIFVDERTMSPDKEFAILGVSPVIRGDKKSFGLYFKERRKQKRAFTLEELGSELDNVKKSPTNLAEFVKLFDAAAKMPMEENMGKNGNLQVGKSAPKDSAGRLYGEMIEETAKEADFNNNRGIDYGLRFLSDKEMRLARYRTSQKRNLKNLSAGSILSDGVKMVAILAASSIGTPLSGALVEGAFVAKDTAKEILDDLKKNSPVPVENKEIDMTDKKAIMSFLKNIKGLKVTREEDNAIEYEIIIFNNSK